MKRNVRSRDNRRWNSSFQGGLRIVMFMINFNFTVCTVWTTRHTAAQTVLVHVHVINMCTRTLYKLRDSLIGFHCCRSEVCVVSRVNYGTDDVFADRGTADRVLDSSDPVARVIRAGETGILAFAANKDSRGRKLAGILSQNSRDDRISTFFYFTSPYSKINVDLFKRKVNPNLNEIYLSV